MTALTLNPRMHLRLVVLASLVWGLCYVVNASADDGCSNEMFCQTDECEGNCVWTPGGDDEQISSEPPSEPSPGDTYNLWATDFCDTIGAALGTTWIFTGSEWVRSEPGTGTYGDFDLESETICNLVATQGPSGNPPCENLIISSDGTVTCTGQYSVQATAQVPCLNVLRDPYPRGMVSFPNVFWIDGPYSATGTASSRQWCTANIRNYTLQVRWLYLPEPAPIWHFDERAWSSDPAQAAGAQVTHKFETSSFNLSGSEYCEGPACDKPANGPSLNGKLELPSYQVRVATNWMAQVRRTWEERVRLGPITFSCASSDGACLALQAFCEQPANEFHDDCYLFEWRPVDTGWQTADLRDYGYPAPYYTSWAAQDQTMPPPGIPLVPLSERACGIIPVPIIETQSLLNAPGAGSQ